MRLRRRKPITISSLADFQREFGVSPYAWEPHRPVPLVARAVGTAFGWYALWRALSKRPLRGRSRPPTMAEVMAALERPWAEAVERRQERCEQVMTWAFDWQRLEPVRPVPPPFQTETRDANWTAGW